MSEALKLVLDEIQGLRSDVREDNQALWKAIEDGRKCATKTKLNVERQNGRLNSLEERRGNLEEHIDNDDAHFNKEKAQQTNIGYLAKKRVLIIFLTALGILVSTATGLAVAWMNGLIPGG